MTRFWTRLIVVLTVILGVNYVAWRWMASLNWDAWWIAVPLVIAETYSLIDVMLFGLTVWNIKFRKPPPPLPRRRPQWTSSSPRTTSPWIW